MCNGSKLQIQGSHFDLPESFKLETLWSVLQFIFLNWQTFWMFYNLSFELETLWSLLQFIFQIRNTLDVLPYLYINILFIYYLFKVAKVWYFGIWILHVSLNWRGKNTLDKHMCEFDKYIFQRYPNCDVLFWLDSYQCC